MNDNEPDNIIDLTETFARLQALHGARTADLKVIFTSAKVFYETCLIHASANHHNLTCDEVAECELQIEQCLQFMKRELLRLPEGDD